jgi:hypothetical protein
MAFKKSAGLAWVHVVITWESAGQSLKGARGKMPMYPLAAPRTAAERKLQPSGRCMGRSKTLMFGPGPLIICARRCALCTHTEPSDRGPARPGPNFARFMPQSPWFGLGLVAKAAGGQSYLRGPARLPVRHQLGGPAALSLRKSRRKIPRPAFDVALG